MPAGLVKCHGFAVPRGGKPERHNIQRAHGSYSAARGVEQVYNWRSLASRLLEQNSSFDDGPTRPRWRSHARGYQRFATSIRWYLPDFRIRIRCLGVVNELSVCGCKRCVAAQLGHLHWCAAVRRNPPDLPIASAAGCEINPFAILRPARTTILVFILSEQARRTPAQADHIDSRAISSIGIEHDRLAVRRPSRCARITDSAQLNRIAAVAIADPNFHGSRAIRHEGKLFAVRRKLRAGTLVRLAGQRHENARFRFAVHR